MPEDQHRRRSRCRTLRGQPPSSSWAVDDEYETPLFSRDEPARLVPLAADRVHDVQRAAPSCRSSSSRRTSRTLFWVMRCPLSCRSALAGDSSKESAARARSQRAERARLLRAEGLAARCATGCSTRRRAAGAAADRRVGALRRRLPRPLARLGAGGHRARGRGRTDDASRAPERRRVGRLRCCAATLRSRRRSPRARRKAVTPGSQKGLVAVYLSDSRYYKILAGGNSQRRRVRRQ